MNWFSKIHSQLERKIEWFKADGQNSFLKWCMQTAHSQTFSFTTLKLSQKLKKDGQEWWSNSGRSTVLAKFKIFSMKCLDWHRLTRDGESW